MALSSPRASAPRLLNVPLDWPDRDEHLRLIVRAIYQLQELENRTQAPAPTADYTVLDTDLLVAVDASGGNITVSLPTASGALGRLIEIKKTDSTTNTVSISPSGSETIDGVTGLTLTQQNACRGLRSDGTNWQIVSALGYATMP